VRAYVITLMDVPESVAVAERCIASGAEFDVDVEKHKATTPDDEYCTARGIEEAFDIRGFSALGFEGNHYSRRLPCMATFYSHAFLWMTSMLGVGPILILEHDAVFRAPLPDIPADVDFCNFGHPSFGKFETPPDGFGPLVSKRYMPGAHAYYVTPKGAEMLLAKAATEAEPTDVYLNIDRFPFLMEYHPWPVVCDDSFSTIQKELGCRAKHNEVKPL